MIKFSNSRTYIIIKDIKELEIAKQCDLCMHIVMEVNNVIYMWDLVNFKWLKSKYTAFGAGKNRDDKTTGLEAYLEFYKYCGKSEIEKMKTIFKPIEIWESYEGMHYCNLEYVGTKLYQDIYEFDANAAYAYGATQLPAGFELLSEYMINLFEKRLNSLISKEKARIKNLIVYLVGYFARVKEFIAVRSEIINASNHNIRKHMIKIRNNGGTVFLSNTDSIITDTKGAEIMLPLVSNKLGCFKLNTFTNKLYYRSPNAYQLGDKIKYSGVGYFAQKHTDFFKGYDATKKGNLIDGYDFELNELTEEPFYHRLCRVKYGEIIVTVVNQLGEIIDKIVYKLGE